MTPAPAQPVVPYVPDRVIKPRKPAEQLRLKLPGASVELVVVAVVICGVRVDVRDGLGGHSGRTQAQAAMKLGGRVVFAAAVVEVTS